ncbi:MAG: prepilin-type N-terminal cleavage/methylation domain-containing protein, partial [bacterium]|nr:prepilin-type N-terminal cleavage/methylation domain-containing protein [bacterium]
MVFRVAHIPKTSDLYRGERRGFTLVEMLVVLTILGLLVGMSWPSVHRLLSRSRVKEAAKQVRTELGEARLRAIESGTPQVFRFQPGTSFFEVRPKEEETAGPAVLKSALEQVSDEASGTKAIAGAEIVD